MLAEYKTKTNIGVGLSVLLIAGRRFVDAGPIVESGMLGLGLLLMVYGCASYAKGKGYHPAFGLLGVLSLLGFIILALFPDKNKETNTSGV